MPAPASMFSIMSSARRASHYQSNSKKNIDSNDSNNYPAKYINDDYKKNAEIKEGKGYTVYHKKELTDDQKQKYELYSRLGYMKRRTDDIDELIAEINKLDSIADNMLSKYGQEIGIYIIISGYLLDDEQTIDNLITNSSSYRQQHNQEFIKICSNPYSLDEIFEFNHNYQISRYNDVLNILNNYYRQRGEKWFDDDMKNILNNNEQILDLPNYKVIQEFEKVYINHPNHDYYEARRK